MHWDGGVRIHIEESRLNDVDHLIASSRIDCDLKVWDNDPEVPPKAANH